MVKFIFLNYRVFIKNCVFPQFTATYLLHVGDQLILARDPSVHSHSYWLTIFVQPIAAQYWRRRGRKI